MSFDASKYTQSKWLHGSDLAPGQILTLTIREALEHSFDDGSRRPVISFLEIEQQFALNKTQTGTLISLFGPNAGAWIGQRIELMAVPSNYNGKSTVLIRQPAAQPMPTFNGAQMGQPPPATPPAAPATTFVEPTMGGAQGDDARRLWESQQPAAAPKMPQQTGGVTFR